MVGGTTPPQSDSSEISRVLVLNLDSSEISRVLVLNLLWQSKRCSRTAPDISVLTTPSLLSRGTQDGIIANPVQMWATRPSRVGPCGLVSRVPDLARQPRNSAETQTRVYWAVVFHSVRARKGFPPTAGFEVKFR